MTISYAALLEESLVESGMDYNMSQLMLLDDKTFDALARRYKSDDVADNRTSDEKLKALVTKYAH